MEGGAGNSKGSGFAGLFGAGGGVAGPSYSHADLAGVPQFVWRGVTCSEAGVCVVLVDYPTSGFRSKAIGITARSSLTGMNPLSPYLNVDPRYLIQDTDEFILPTGASKTRGRFELAFFTIGGCCITGAAFGALNGLRLGLKETQNMAWSKPRNVQILNMVTRQGALWANTLGSLALLYSAFGVIVEKTRGAEDDLNTAGLEAMKLFVLFAERWIAWGSQRWRCRTHAHRSLCALQQLGAHEGLHATAVPLSGAEDGASSHGAQSDLIPCVTVPSRHLPTLKTTGSLGHGPVLEQWVVKGAILSANMKLPSP
ncbi:putative Mitochondrial import inner membrane translocase subunit TIM23 protein [Naja naja]|nr:putative Mitochondrial import inner membrane translocase subunit TIM23 protein [Naja naja]